MVIVVTVEEKAGALRNLADESRFRYTGPGHRLYNLRQQLET